ncbi:MAG: ribonuclease P protein component [Chloroflexi bacterium RBG_13_46_9]|nr:MAG: ribonuclease P protein component [Chloroflexi bacterium RBG_13_46_9]
MEGSTGRIEHLTRPEQYTMVYSKGRSWSNDLIVLRAMPNGLPISRSGLSISKRVGKAVVRNKVKRRLREIVRLSAIKPGWDIVLVARSRSSIATYAELQKAVLILFNRARILESVKQE